MSDTIVERKGFGTRMKNSFSGVFGGIIILLIGIGILIFNERNNVKNIHNIKELRDNYVDIVSSKVDKEYDGKLIVTSGKLDFGDVELTDSTFNVSVKTPLLVRTVEMYQWEEEKEDKDDKTVYSYKLVWSDEAIDSSSFKDSSSHTNPGSLPYEGKSETAQNLKVGEYKLSSSFTSLLSADYKYTDLANATVPEGYTVKDGYIMKSADPEKPQVGDVRISFSYASYSDVSVLGKLTGDTIAEYETKEGTKIKRFTDGVHDGNDIITSMEKGNKLLKWGLRLLGTILIMAGVASVFGPLKTLTSYVPILGGLVNGVTGLMAFLIGLAISLVVIAVSWIIFRPLLGIALLAGAILLIVLAVVFSSKKKKQEPVQPNQM